MHITSALRLCPFTHLAGNPCLVPGTDWVCKIYPTLLLLYHEEKKVEISLPFKGPVRPFTIFQDLERGYIEVSGKEEKGPFRFRLIAEEKQLKLLSLKGPLKSFFLAPIETAILAPKERLSLGIHKQQDWQMVCRRSDPTEVLPFWVRLAAWTPEKPWDAKENRGTYALLVEKEKNQQYEQLRQAFEGCFEGILVPRLTDGHLGLIEDERFPKGLPALPILHRGASLIRSLFVRFEEEAIALLPHLPPEFHAGRFMHIQTLQEDIFSLEWSKKQLKKVSFKAGTTRLISWKLQRFLQSYRLRINGSKRGVRFSVKEKLSVERGHTYFLDRFEK